MRPPAGLPLTPGLPGSRRTLWGPLRRAAQRGCPCGVLGRRGPWSRTEGRQKFFSSEGQPGWQTLQTAGLGVTEARVKAEDGSLAAGSRRGLGAGPGEGGSEGQACLVRIGGPEAWVGGGWPLGRGLSPPPLPVLPHLSWVPTQSFWSVSPSFPWVLSVL